jgi:hypothetical protein
LATVSIWSNWKPAAAKTIPVKSEQCTRKIRS